MRKLHYIPISIFLCSFLLFVPHGLFSQKKATPKISNIKAIASADSCSCIIRIRWSPTDPYAWKLANTYGYTIERHTVLRKGQVVLIPEKKILTASPIKPKPLKEWEAICRTDDNAAIMAQGIYGDDFEVSANSGKLAQIINQSNNLTQRFTFSLLAAERSFTAACMAGLAWSDSTVRANEKYLYRIYPNTPKDKLLCDTALVFVGSSEHFTLPKPVDMYAAYGDRNVLLSWDGKILKDFYSSYIIERSEDGEHFKPLSDLPFTAINDEAEKEQGRVFFTDTIQNNKSFSYRVKGITPFGEVGPPSEVMHGAGQAILAFVPNIKDAQITNDSTAVISWEFPEEGAPLIDHFELNRANRADDSQFIKVIKRIDAAKREVSYSPLQPTNYFTITAVDKNGNQRTSFPYLVQPVDSVPPAIPTGLTATIDSLGNVSLQWTANTEPDLLGYVVLKGNTRTDEPSIINNHPLQTNAFAEKTDINTLNAKAYYSVMALDKRMNQSKPCKPFEVIKPDKIPPTTPILTEYTATDDGKIHLSWIASSSEDVVCHRLLRKAEKDTAWTTVTSATDPQTTRYTDTPPAGNEVWLYTLLAIDHSNNPSKPSPALRTVVKTRVPTDAIRNLRTDIDRNAHNITISWKANRDEITEYTLYKAVNNGPFTTLQIVPSTQLFYTDTDLSVNNTYKYAIRPKLKNGRNGLWKEVKTEY